MTRHIPEDVMVHTRRSKAGLHRSQKNLQYINDNDIIKSLTSHQPSKKGVIRPFPVTIFYVFSSVLSYFQYTAKLKQLHFFGAPPPLGWASWIFVRDSVV